MALSVATGTYVGNSAGSGTRSFTGLGFQPKMVFVWSDSTTVTWPIMGYDTLPQYVAIYWGNNGWQSGTTMDTFQSFDSDGWTIRNGTSTGASRQMNLSGENFYYLALGGTDIVTGTFSGNSTDNRAITGVGFQPIYVYLQLNDNGHMLHKFDNASTDSCSTTLAEANRTNGIQTLDSDGFTVGNQAFPYAPNTTGKTTYWFAIKGSDNAVCSSFSGNGSDNRAITSIGLTPTAVIIKSASAYGPVMRIDEPTGDKTKYNNSAGFVADYIQSLDSGGFTVGTQAGVNNSGQTIQYLAFSEVQPSTFIPKCVVF